MLVDAQEYESVRAFARAHARTYYLPLTAHTVNALLYLQTIFLVLQSAVCVYVNIVRVSMCMYIWTFVYWMFM